eukprot:COSAG02_NODE_25965_length_644_cov_1.086239_1_plen_47_part_10
MTLRSGRVRRKAVRAAAIAGGSPVTPRRVARNERPWRGRVDGGVASV